MKKSLNRQRELLSGMSGKFIQKNLAAVDFLEGISSGITKISNGLSDKLKEISKSLKESKKELQEAEANRENTRKELEKLSLDLNLGKDKSKDKNTDRNDNLIKIEGENSMDFTNASSDYKIDFVAFEEAINKFVNGE